MLKIYIVDGYIDEPTCLGVPPYISPYPRYIAGAIWNYDPKALLWYVTIDQLRNDTQFSQKLTQSDMIIVIAGVSVPGRYLAGFPVSPHELIRLLAPIQSPLKLLTGPAARYGFGGSGGKKAREVQSVEDVFDGIITGDGEIVISELLKNNLNIDSTDITQCRESPDSMKDFAITGANIVQQHPFYPDHLITEIETYRGCSRSIVGGCSFCVESQKGLPQFREIKDIVNEIKALAQNGIQHFRIGSQPCIFSYMATGVGDEEFPTPNPEALEQLFRGIRLAAPNLKTLHIDNANPGILARYPDECRQIAQTIITYHTSGDVAALGVESVDPEVIKQNNLKASADEILKAIELLHSVGSKRGKNGLPELLPGLNFVFGLPGESKQTFRYNFDFLQQILTSGFLIRRINLRQVIPLPGTQMYSFGEKNVRKHKAEFKRFKKQVRENIEKPMLKKLVPNGTVLHEVFSEKHDGKLTFGRQMGSYPLLIGMPGVFNLDRFYDVRIVDFGYRSVTGIPIPLDINTASRETIEALPGVGKKRATRILLKRPFTSKDDIVEAFDDPEVGRKILMYL